MGTDEIEAKRSISCQRSALASPNIPQPYLLDTAPTLSAPPPHHDQNNHGRFPKTDRLATRSFRNVSANRSPDDGQVAGSLHL